MKNIKKSSAFLAVFLLALFLVVNLSIINLKFPHSYPYRFCSDKGKFEVLELGKGRDPLGRVQLAFEDYKVRTNKLDLKLYRRFERKWWQVWNWVDFLANKRWCYPYAERDEDT